MLECSSQDARIVCINYEAVHEINFQDIKNPTTLPSFLNPMNT